MSDNVTRNDEILSAETEKINKLKEALNKIKNKDVNFLFFVTDTNAPSAAINEIYFHANVVKRQGYKVTMLTDTVDFEIPYWVDTELTDIEHKPMESARLSVGPQDVLVIPDIFSNVMEQTKNLPCIRVGMLNSIDYMMNGLIPATDWSSFGIRDVITTSNSLKDFMESFFRNKFDIKVYNIGIPSYFHRSDVPQRPIINVVGRNPNEISKLIKLFYARFPQYGWITFDTMITDSKPPRSLGRKEFADRLRQNFATIWIDRIASFGTLPLEAMACGSIPIGLLPDITPEYLLETGEAGEARKFIENSGVWTDSFYSLPILIGETITKFLDDSISDDTYDVMSGIANKYTQKQSENDLIAIYDSLLNKRAESLQKAVDDFEAVLNNNDIKPEEVVEESK